MKALPKLHELIKSLSLPEKKFVKQYMHISSKGRDDNNLLNLFNEMEKVNNYDEYAFKKKHAGKSFIKNLAVNKINLEEKILFALFVFNKENDPHIKVKVLTAQAKIAHHRGASVTAFKMLDKAQKLCIYHELFEEQLDVNNTLISFKSQTQYEALKNIENNIDISNKLHNLYNYQLRSRIYSKFANTYGHSNFNETKRYINDLAAMPEYQNPDMALSIRAKVYYYLVGKENARLENNLPLVYKLSMEVLAMYENSPGVKAINAGGFIKLLYDCIRFNIWQLSEEDNKANSKKLRSELDVLMTKMEKAIKADFVSREEQQTAELIKIQAILYYKELTQKNELLDAFYKSLLKRLTVENFNLLNLRLGHVVYSIATTLVLKKNTALALAFNNVILSEKKDTFTKDTLYFSHFLRLMIHFDLGNYSLIENLIRSTERFLKLNNYYHAGEKEILKFFRALVSVSKSEQLKTLTAFHTAISKLDVKNCFQFDHDFYRLLIWLEQHTSKKPVKIPL